MVITFGPRPLKVLPPRPSPSKHQYLQLVVHSRTVKGMLAIWNKCKDPRRFLHLTKCRNGRK